MQTTADAADWMFGQVERIFDRGLFSAVFPGPDGVALADTEVPSEDL